MKFVESMIKNIPNNKATGEEISSYILKQCIFTYHMLTDCINNALSQGTLPDSLQFANITPVHKEDEASDKQSYRPVKVYLYFQKFLKKSFMINLVNIWINT